MRTMIHKNESIVVIGSLLFMYRNELMHVLNTIWNPKKTIVTLYSVDDYYTEFLHYIYQKYPDKMNDISYSEQIINTYNDFSYRKNREHTKKKLIKPHECNFDIDYDYDGVTYKINIDLSVVTDKVGITKIMQPKNCVTGEEILSKLVITCSNKDTLISLLDTAKKEITDEYEKTRKTSKETMRIFYYKSDFWVLLSKSPKRPINTLYLKEGEKEKLIKNVSTFFSKDTRNIYLEYGIPYKSVYMIYGPPGSGKTSTIKSIASVLDCDLFVLPIVKDMLDNDLVSAFSYINEQDSKERIIVIEDVDTIFDDRKKGDDTNGITLQGFLNCLDGFTCVEGTMLFITANKPEVLDSAFIRSCRIDHKLKLGNADEYQTRKMFETFLPNQMDKFKELYSIISRNEYTTAALQEFLFYNRDCDDILKIANIFADIVEKNDPKKFEILKDETKNFYS